MQPRHLNRDEILEKEKEKELLLGVPLIDPLLGSDLVANVLLKRFEPTRQDKIRLYRNEQQIKKKFSDWHDQLPKYNVAMLKRQSKIRVKNQKRDNETKTQESNELKRKDRNKVNNNYNNNNNNELKVLPMMDEDRMQVFNQALTRLTMPNKGYYVKLQGFRQTHGLLISKMYNQYFVKEEHRNRLIKKLCNNFEQNYHILLKWAFQLVIQKDKVWLYCLFVVSCLPNSCLYLFRGVYVCVCVCTYMCIDNV